MLVIDMKITFINFVFLFHLYGINYGIKINVFVFNKWLFMYYLST